MVRLSFQLLCFYDELCSCHQEEEITGNKAWTPREIPFFVDSQKRTNNFSQLLKEEEENLKPCYMSEGIIPLSEKNIRIHDFETDVCAVTQIVGETSTTILPDVTRITLWKN